jgi:membrane protease YdiL (CAAX protease family)
MAQTAKACVYGVGTQILSAVVGSVLSMLVFVYSNAVVAAVSFPISCAMVAAVMSVGHVRPLGERGSVGNRMVWMVAAVALTCVTWYASVTLATYVVNNIGDPAFSSYSQGIAASVSGDDAWVGVVCAVVLSPLCEEVVHRRGGYASMVSGGAPRWLACLLSSVLFAVSHGTMAHLMLTMVVGMVLCVVYERIGGVVPCALIHIGVNAASLTLVPVVGDDVVSACIALLVGLGVSVGCLLMLPRRSDVVCSAESENAE